MTPYAEVTFVVAKDILHQKIDMLAVFDSAEPGIYDESYLAKMRIYASVLSFDAETVRYSFNPLGDDNSINKFKAMQLGMKGGKALSSAINADLKKEWTGLLASDDILKSFESKRDELASKVGSAMVSAAPAASTVGCGSGPTKSFGVRRGSGEMLQDQAPPKTVGWASKSNSEGDYFKAIPLRTKSKSKAEPSKSRSNLTLWFGIIFIVAGIVLLGFTTGGIFPAAGALGYGLAAGFAVVGATILGFRQRKAGTKSPSAKSQGYTRGQAPDQKKKMLEKINNMLTEANAFPDSPSGYTGPADLRYNIEKLTLDNYKQKLGITNMTSMLEEIILAVLLGGDESSAKERQQASSDVQPSKIPRETRLLRREDLLLRAETIVNEMISVALSLKVITRREELQLTNLKVEYIAIVNTQIAIEYLKNMLEIYGVKECYIECEWIYKLIENAQESAAEKPSPETPEYQRFTEDLNGRRGKLKALGLDDDKVQDIVTAMIDIDLKFNEIPKAGYNSGCVSHSPTVGGTNYMGAGAGAGLFASAPASKSEKLTQDQVRDLEDLVEGHAIKVWIIDTGNNGRDVSKTVGLIANLKNTFTSSDMSNLKGNVEGLLQKKLAANEYLCLGTPSEPPEYFSKDAGDGESYTLSDSRPDPGVAREDSIKGFSNLLETNLLVKELELLFS